MSDVLNAVMAQYDNNTKSTKKKPKMSDEDRKKLYFSTTLPKNKTAGSKTFRILTPKPGKSPFEEVFFHELKLGDKWQKLYCPKKNKTGDCPLCMIEEEANKSSLKEDKDTASTYRARKFYIVKGIDREFEEDGPKFWRFRHNFKKEGIMDKIVPIFTAKGDITNPDKGRDLIISLGRDDNNYTKITTIMNDDACPLSEDAELASLWLDHEMTWEDVYSRHSFEYLEIVAQGDIPYWDKTGEKWITKTEYENRSTNRTPVETLDDNKEPTTIIGGNKQPEKPVEESKPKVTKTPAKVEETNDDVDVEMEDLPF